MVCVFASKLDIRACCAPPRFRFKELRIERKRADAISHLALIDPALVLLLPASLHSLPMLIL